VSRRSYAIDTKDKAAVFRISRVASGAPGDGSLV
jgi:hypothetical protein